MLSLGELILSNKGDEPSINNMLDVVIDSAMFDFVDVDTWRCNYRGSKISCSLPYLDKSGNTYGDRTIPLELKLKSGSIPSDVDSISMGLKMTTKCSGQQGALLLDSTLTVPVEHHWTMKAAQSPDQSGKILSWNSEDEDDEEVTLAHLTYDVKNTGPSMTQKSTIFVYIPKSTRHSSNFLKGVNVTYNDAPCTIEDKGRIQRPLPPDTNAESGTKVNILHLIFSISFHLSLPGSELYKCWQL